MNPENLPTDLAASPFLAGMSDHHVKLLVECASQTHFDEGRIIFRQGETANRFYLIQTGKVELEAVVRPGGRAIVVDTIGAGELLGWSWLFEPFEWQFTARALSATEAIFFYGTVLREYCNEDPSLGFELFQRMSKVMMKRLQSARRRLLEVKAGFSPVGGEHAVEAAD
ncbi:MAG TPA: cyclic nucleotide-binding domain-containing protein [Chthoniobacterales bacterium]|nr:cyclic nucleotide-binding domain-containing protein [Chthoniobacterales bacterium]